MYIKYLKYKAFTLAELMICLCVIAGISAMIIPTLITHKPNNTKVLLKKSYQVAERTVTELLNDTYLYPPYDYEHSADFAFFIPELSSVNQRDLKGVYPENVPKNMEDTGEYFYNNFKNKLNIVDSDTDDENHTFVTTDGVTWSIDAGAFCDPNYNNGVTCEYTDKTCEQIKYIGYSPVRCITVDVSKLSSEYDESSPKSSKITAANASKNINYDDITIMYIQVFYNGKLRLPQDEAKQIMSDTTIATQEDD